MSNRPLYTIGIMAEVLGIHQRTLRIYDKEGLLVPKRNTKNRRLYSQDDIEKAKLILYLTRNLGVNLNAVKMIIGIFNYMKTPEQEHLEYIKQLSFKVAINQEKNILKASRKGRKKLI